MTEAELREWAEDVATGGHPMMRTLPIALAVLELLRQRDAERERVLAAVDEDDRKCTFCRGWDSDGCGGTGTYVAQLRRRLGDGA